MENMEPNSSRKPQPIILLGAGELGTAILNAILAHPRYDASLMPITLALRPSTISSPPAHRAAEFASYRARNITLLGLDTEGSSTESLAAAFAKFHVVLGAGGMYAKAGTVRKVSDAVIAAGVPRYLPWQYGVDYDVLGPKIGGGLFAEQCGVREVLRAQTKTEWVAVGCGVFMSFLFEDFWGVIGRDKEGKDKGKIRVRALGSWDNTVTATNLRDIGATAAALLLEEEQLHYWRQEHKVYIAGQTITYAQLADLAEKISGEEVIRELWDSDRFEKGMAAEPDNKLWNYWATFGGRTGVSWPEEGTWSQRRGMKMITIEDWMKEDWKP